MKVRILSHGGKFRVGLLGVLVIGVNTHAAENPYAKTIVDRNVFNLNKARAAEIIVPPSAPPPRITVQGVTNILLRRQVLFKVQLPAKLGETAKEISCVLSEGERQGEIEVLEIDIQAGAIKFNNHGIVKNFSLKDSAVKPPLPN